MEDGIELSALNRSIHPLKWYSNCSWRWLIRGLEKCGNRESRRWLEAQCGSQSREREMDDTIELRASNRSIHLFE
jgi:hypothetical protein